MTPLTLEDPKTEVLVGDCRKVLDAFPPEHFRLVFADPPFNWDVKYGGWNDGMPRDDYLKFTYQWLSECFRVLDPRGSLWVNIPDDTAAEVVIFGKECGLHLRDWCLWHYRFGQHTDRKFIVSKTHALHFVKSNEHYVWNPEAVKEPSDRASIYGDPRTRETRSPGLRVPLDVWYGEHWGRVQGNNKERRPAHQNQLPEVYLERVIRSCSNEGDRVLDPFLGSGTTCVVARTLGRESVGIEYSEELAASAFRRILEGAVRVQ